MRVVEFKKENSVSKAKLAAGMIIDKYLTEDAENYIHVHDNDVNEIINDYERACTLKSNVSLNIFDKAA